ncbi:MAG: sigma-54-dependent transcriptional regulator [Polyangiales bacterium]
MSKILVIEDDDSIRANILDLLEAEGFEGIGAPDGEQGVTLAMKHLPDLVICDIAMPGIDGFGVFELLSERPSTAVIPFIFLSARAERADIRRGMALGADDYLTKPFTRAELLDSLHARLRRRATRGDTLPPTSAPATPTPVSVPSSGPEAFEDRVVVVDPAMAALFEQVERVARGPISVLILGETGVGKEVVAEEIHRRSGRRGRFVPLNCAALTESLLESELFGYEKGAFTGAVRSQEGLFESAEGGTLFLDEVGELPQSTQVKLLRVLEERKVMRVGGRSARAIDVRFVSATNRDLELEVERGGFRQDLFFRLNGISFSVPPLRERHADIQRLAARFITMHCRAVQRVDPPSLSDQALQVLIGYRWPGNIRELRNVIERAVLLCDGPALLPNHLPEKLTSKARNVGTGGDVDPRARLALELEHIERERLIEALQRCGGNQTQAAELLGISRRTVVTRLEQYDLPRPRKRP